MAKYRVHAFYLITLKRDEGSYAEDPSWGWTLTRDGHDIAWGSTYYRWTAIRRAKKAARRDAKGKPPTSQARSPKPNILGYRTATWKKL